MIRVRYKPIKNGQKVPNLIKTEAKKGCPVASRLKELMEAGYTIGASGSGWTAFYNGECIGMGSVDSSTSAARPEYVTNLRSTKASMERCYAHAEAGLLQDSLSKIAGKL